MLSKSQCLKNHLPIFQIKTSFQIINRGNQDIYKHSKQIEFIKNYKNMIPNSKRRISFHSNSCQHKYKIKDLLGLTSFLSSILSYKGQIENYRINPFKIH